MSEDTVDRIPSIHADAIRREHRKYMASLLSQRPLNFIQPEGRTCACNRCPHAAWCQQ